MPKMRRLDKKLMKLSHLEVQKDTALGKALNAWILEGGFNSLHRKLSNNKALFKSVFEIIIFVHSWRLSILASKNRKLSDNHGVKAFNSLTLTSSVSMQN